MAYCIGRRVESIELFRYQKGKKTITRYEQSNDITLLFEVVQKVSSRNVEALFWVFDSPTSRPKYNRHECK